MTDYKAELHESITKLQAETKRGELPRALRMVKIEALTEDYYAKTGEMPDDVALERLADLCLYEELTDTDLHKVAHTEYPFLSEHQFDHRSNREFTVGEAVENNATDGRDYSKPVRKKRSDYENKFLDKRVKSRNKERKRKYGEFVKIQPVITYDLRNLNN